MVGLGLGFVVIVVLSAVRTPRGIRVPGHLVADCPG